MLQVLLHIWRVSDMCGRWCKSDKIITAKSRHVPNLAVSNINGYRLFSITVGAIPRTALTVWHLDRQCNRSLKLIFLMSWCALRYSQALSPSSATGEYVRIQGMSW